MIRKHQLPAIAFLQWHFSASVVLIILIPFMVGLLLSGCVKIDSSVIIEGRILDEKHQPISSALIEISGRELDVSESGFFCYEGVSSGMNMEMNMSIKANKKLIKSFFNEASVSIAAT